MGLVMGVSAAPPFAPGARLSAELDDALGRLDEVHGYDLVGWLSASPRRVRHDRAGQLRLVWEITRRVVDTDSPNCIDPLIEPVPAPVPTGAPAPSPSAWAYNPDDPPLWLDRPDPPSTPRDWPAARAAAIRNARAARRAPPPRPPTSGAPDTLPF